MEIDPSKLSLAPVGARSVTPRPSKRLPRHKRGEKFLRGPVPLAWLSKAAALPGKSLAVGVAIWFQAGIEKTDTVKLTGGLIGQFAVGRKALARCLNLLEGAGLVFVIRKPGCSPKVTIREPDA